MAMSADSTRKRAWLHGAVPLGLGVVIYALFRGPNLVVLRWLAPLHLDGPLGRAHAFAAPVRPLLPHWVLYNLPDALWGYTVGATLALTWSRSAAAKSRLSWLVGGLFVVCMFEVAQSLGLVPGTFDWVDLIFSSVGYAAGAFFVLRRTASRSHAESFPLGGHATFTGEDT
jgi:hypothetical protein